jgi:carbon-monoxide dehydrogenase medium subunit
MPCRSIETSVLFRQSEAEGTLQAGGKLMHWDSYRIAKTVEEALDSLEYYQGKAQVIAGGTDLVLQLAERQAHPGLTLLDISSIPNIRGVEITNDGEWVLVGAATTMAELAESPIISTHARALALAAASMGAPQIRNVATIGGNVVNAQPAADGTIPLLALGAEARVVSTGAEKWIAVNNLFLDVGKSSVNHTKEIVTHFRFKPTGVRGASSTQRLARRNAFTLPTLLVAARIELDTQGESFANVRVAAGPVARIPGLATDTADTLLGAPVTYEAIDRAAAQAKLAAHPRDSLRAGAEYRKEMVHVLVRRALLECVSLLKVSANG